MAKECYLSIRMDRETHDKIQYVAAYEGRSMSRQILHLMQENIHRFEREHGPIHKEDMESP